MGSHKKKPQAANGQQDQSTVESAESADFPGHFARVTVIMRTLGELIGPELKKLSAAEITEFWNRLYEIAGKKSVDGQATAKVLSDIPERSKQRGHHSPPPTSSDNDVNEALGLAESIVDMAGEVSWPDADNVADKASSIADSIEKSGRVTPKQLQALLNMHSAMQRWHDRGSDDRSRGGGRDWFDLPGYPDDIPF